MAIVPRRSISLAQTPTPFQYLKRFSTRDSGPRIWVKRDDLTGSVLSGNKVRKLEFLCAEALQKNATVLITCGGVQSNHCRATALVAAQLGLKCHLILRDEPTGEFNGNLLLDHVCGANISTYPKKNFSKNLTSYFQHWQDHYASVGEVAYSIPTGGSNGIGVNGYLQCVNELEQDFKNNEISPKYLFCASGSGGTQAGLSLGFAQSSYATKVVGVAVCDNEQYFYEKINQDIEQWKKYENNNFDIESLHIKTLDQYIGQGYGLANEQVMETIALLAKEEGIVLDPVYTGKAFMGMLDYIKQLSLSKNDDVVFVHTGGMFGLFPYHEQLESYLSLGVKRS